MVHFDNKFDAVMYGEALLAGVNMTDREIAEVSSVLQRETLEQMHNPDGSSSASWSKAEAACQR